MTTHLKSYPDYKPSGVEWLGDVPAHWEVRRLRSLTNITTGGQDTINQQDDGKYPFFVRSQTVEKIDTWSFDGEAVLTAGDGVGVGKVFHYINGKFDYHQRVYKFSDFSAVSGKFFFHYFRALLRFEVLQGTAKSTVDSLRLPMLQNFPVALPPLSEQTAIVRYLDQADERIRRYVRNRERLIELLEEYRQAIIHHAVTRGLDPDVRLMPTGVEWLGDVPAHWEVRRLQHVVTMKVSNVDKHIKEGELPVRLCNYVDVYKNDRITESVSFMRATATTDEIERFRLESGDVLITKDSEVWNDIGVPALVEYSARDLVCGYHLALLRPIKAVLNGAYLFRSLQSSTIAYQFHISANGVTRYGLSRGGIKSALLPIPPLSEQAAIVAYLDKATAEIDVAIDRARREIELLGEYRTRLIADVVTGKVDVREAAVGLSDDGDVSSLDF